ncbi:AraC family transcriptional regulator [Roseibium sp.]|uniref:AraC family transcriptional regulator n=1 Tax=Roseibium sp. TaxID=1936156 RepID=UPI003B51750D
MNGNSTRGFQKQDLTGSLENELGQDLVRLCKIDRDEIRTAQPEAGIERIEAKFHGNGFSFHRHDTYAIGLTVNGIQRFKYRGEERASEPGQVIVIHPDELHDGGAGTDTGLRYRMLYIPPEHITEALGGSALPHVPTPVLSDPAFQRSLIEALDDIDQEMGDLKVSSVLSDLSACLKRFSDDKSDSKRTLDWPGLKKCAEFLKENATDPVVSGDLEEIANLDRFALARQFRKAFGTSPHRYLVMRRLEQVKQELASGESLASAAVTTGFADQSHMSRHFKRAYGMSPGKWRHLNAASQT